MCLNEIRGSEGMDLRRMSRRMELVALGMKEIETGGGRSRRRGGLRVLWMFY